MHIGSYTKLIVTILVVGSATFLAYTEKIPAETATAIITAALGYVFGNATHILERNRSENIRNGS